MNKETPIITIDVLDESLKLPTRAFEGDAGLDLCSAEDVVLKPMEFKEIFLGLKVEIKKGFIGYLQPRSGLALKHGFSILDSPKVLLGQEDQELSIIGMNYSNEKEFSISKGDRICQLVVLPVCDINFVNDVSLTESERLEGGFGSSGV